MATVVYGNAASSYWKTWLSYSVDNSYSKTKSRISFSYGIYISKELHKENPNSNSNSI